MPILEMGRLTFLEVKALEQVTQLANGRIGVCTQVV